MTQVATKQGDKNKISLVFIVNGEEARVIVNVNEPLKNAIRDALKESGNEARPLEDWQLTTSDDKLIDDLSKKIKDYQFASETILFLNLKAGVGGKF